MHRLLFGLRIIAQKLGLRYDRKLHFDFEDQDASDQIKELLEGDQPVLIARFGSSELGAIIACLNSRKKGLKKYLDYILSKSSAYTLRDSHLQRMHINAGLFPRKLNLVVRFSDLMMEDAKELDLLGSWLSDEYQVMEHIKKKTPSIPLHQIEPYYHENPWTEALRNKKIVVVHPFANTIKDQFENHRELLFSDERILPPFSLETIKAVQTIAGQENSDFKNWFEALDSMKNQLNQMDFDVAIIGCGAYGFPLAAHVKRIGKKAIHLGGATQILFGIKGTRWDNHEFISKLYNEYWSRPSSKDRPTNSNLVENSAYW